MKRERVSGMDDCGHFSIPSPFLSPPLPPLHLGCILEFFNLWPPLFGFSFKTQVGKSEEGVCALTACGAASKQLSRQAAGWRK